jgi:hypothetical protein
MGKVPLHGSVLELSPRSFNADMIGAVVLEGDYTFHGEACLTYPT